MKLGNFNQLKAALTAHFGECYTDDNAVILMNSENPDTMAFLWPVCEGLLLVVPVDDKKMPFGIKVEGAGPEPHEYKVRMSAYALGAEPNCD